MSFIGVSTNVNSEAARTLTRDDIVSLRVLTLRPDRQTCLRIRSLGCVSRRRGCRGGCCKVKPIHPNIIPTVTGRRMNSDHTDKSVRKRRRCLITVGRQPSYNDTPQLTSVPSVYVLNAAALSKPHAFSVTQRRFDKLQLLRCCSY